MSVKEIDGLSFEKLLPRGERRRDEASAGAHGASKERGLVDPGEEKRHFLTYAAELFRQRGHVRLNPADSGAAVRGHNDVHEVVAPFKARALP